MTISYDGNIVVAGTIIKLKSEKVRLILKDHLHDCVFDTYKITEDYVKLVFNAFELTRAISQLSVSYLDYEIKGNIVYIKTSPDSKIDELKEAVVEAPKTEPVKEEVKEVTAEPVKEKVVEAPAPETTKEVVKEEEVVEAPKEEAPAAEPAKVIELSIKPGDALEKLAPGDYKIIFNGINFAILSQGDDRNYIKQEKVITITDKFKKLTGVSTAKKNKDKK